MQTLTRALGGALALATALIMMMPAQALAQACNARVMPAQIDAGASAARLDITLSEPIGAVTGLEAPDGSGLTVAAPQDIPRVQLAADEERTPITMGDAENHWTVWVNTSASEPGTHQVTFIGSEGRCSANLTVQAPR